MPDLRLAELRELDAPAFAAALDGVYEHSPWVAERAHAAGPFAGLAALRTALAAAMWSAEPALQLALIRAHPELAGRVPAPDADPGAAAGELTAASQSEQRGAGLDRCTPDERARLAALNAAYRGKFGFPFVIAVRGLDRAAILSALETRLAHDADTERRTALEQIERIAGLRLAARFGAAEAG